MKLSKNAPLFQIFEKSISGIYVTKFNRLERKQWPKDGGDPLCMSDFNSSNICFFNCYGNASQHACGCIPPMLSGTKPQDNICSPFEIGQNDEMMKNFDICQRAKCKPACTEQTYTSTVTYQQLNMNGGFLTKSVSLSVSLHLSEFILILIS